MTTITQPNYNTAPAIGVHGTIADLTHADVITRYAEDATLAPGLAVEQGAADYGVLLAGGVYIGVAVLDPTRPPSQGDSYVAGDAVAVLYRGTLYVQVPVSVDAGDPVYRTVAGVLTNDPTGNTAIAGASFERTAAASAVSIVRLR